MSADVLTNLFDCHNSLHVRFFHFNFIVYARWAKEIPRSANYKKPAFYHLLDFYFLLMSY